MDGTQLLGTAGAATNGMVMDDNPFEDLYHVPGDIECDWRLKRAVDWTEKFPDEIGPSARAWLDMLDANDDMKIWWVFLYSCTYNMTSAMVAAHELDYKTVTRQQLDDWWWANKSRFQCTSDRRYVWNMNKLPQMVEYFLQQSERQPHAYISSHYASDPVATYSNVDKLVRSWYYFGRFSASLFLFNLMKVYPELPITSVMPLSDWQNGATITAAIMNILHLDKMANDFERGLVLLHNGTQQALQSVLTHIVNELQQRQPDKTWQIVNVAADLCSFRKLFKASRYGGYYVDRSLSEIKHYAATWPEYSDWWELVWKTRFNTLPYSLLGECNGWDGIRSNFNTYFLRTGMMYPPQVKEV